MATLLEELKDDVRIIASDDIPSDEHQDAVTAMAEEYLSVAAGDAGSARLRELNTLFKEHPLLGLEVTDEALVLLKNRRNLWGNAPAQFSDPICPGLLAAHHGYSEAVTRARNGRPRASTTPTLKGGEHRLPKPGAAGDASFLPLIFALKGLEIGYFPSLLSKPGSFSDLASLLRNKDPLPAGTQLQRDAWRAEARSASQPKPAHPMELELLRRSLPNWPADAMYAVQAITVFGAGDGKAARQIALYALRLNNHCTLALQLLTILTDGPDPRVRAGSRQAEMADVLSKMGAGKTPVTASRKPWWKFW
jgi:hypothetical protein